MARRVALVTGASRGIGAATAIALARDGLDVVVHYHEHEAGAQLTAKAVKAQRRRVHVAQADLSRWNEAQRLLASAQEAFGTVDVLVNNAGVYPRKTLDATTIDEWRRTLDTNLSSYFYCAKLAAPGMAGRGWGRIVNVSSILGEKGSKHGAHYSSSKAGILGLTKSLALELAPHGVCVNAVTPGAIETDILRGDTPEVRARRLREIPMGRVGVPEEVADVIAFLCGDGARYVTGQVLGVNGGLLTA